MATLVNVIDTGHDDVIHATELDYYGLYLATCSSDNSIKIFDVRKDANVLVADLRSHQGPVWDLSWAHPKFGHILASCSYDRRIIIWKKRGTTWGKSYEYSCESSVNAIVWAPHEFGMMLASASSDGSILFLTFNQENNKWESVKVPHAHGIGCNSISWCPSLISLRNYKKTGKSLVKRLASGGCDNCVKIWLEENGHWTEDVCLEAHSDWVRHVEWAPTYGGHKTQIASASQDRYVIIWSSENMISWASQTVNVFDDIVWSISWSFTGKVLAINGAQCKISLWREKDDRWCSINDDYNPN